MRGWLRTGFTVKCIRFLVIVCFPSYSWLHFEFDWKSILVPKKTGNSTIDFKLPPLFADGALFGRLS